MVQTESLLPDENQLARPQLQGDVSGQNATMAVENQVGSQGSAELQRYGKSNVQLHQVDLVSGPIEQVRGDGTSPPQTTEKRPIKDWEETKSPETPAVKEYLQHGRDPKDLLTYAMRENRVLMLGEDHHSKAAHRDYLKNLMSDLKEAGATHLAFEISQENLGKLDNYLAGAGSIQQLPPGLRSPKVIALIQAARDAGLKVVPIDTKEEGYFREDMQKRDDHMAAQIRTILDQSSSNKVVFFGGGLHTERRTDGMKSAADLLRASNIPIVTVNEGNAQEDIKDHISAPLAVQTVQTTEVANRSMRSIDDVKYGAWDIIVVYPK